MSGSIRWVRRPSSSINRTARLRHRPRRRQASRLSRIGRDIERRVLARAVKAHLEHRVLVDGHRTIVFSAER
jgi:formyltetrahydrofolate hydrolase